MSNQAPSVALHYRTQDWSDGERRSVMSSQVPKYSPTPKNSAME
jgi:hypothetical protein